MTRKLKLAVLQASFNDERKANIARVCELTRQAAGEGAQVVLPPELFEGPYFPQTHHESHFELAATPAEHPAVQELLALAQELNVIIPVSFFERAGQSYFNSIAMIDGSRGVLGIYRKSHIPEGPGYHEKFYFSPGDTGFQVWETRVGRIGVGICWDQWFPEAARAMVLEGAELLLYPTAIGSEPAEPEVDTKDPWQRAMIGHAVSNAVPIAAANRVGTEDGMNFYGSSFIADQRGEMLAELSREEQGVALAEIDLDEIAAYRANWGFFRDRRPDLYAALTRGKRDGVEH